MQKRIIILVFFALATAQSIFAQGCSQCRLVAEQASELDEASFGSNINTGILYLMLIPYLLIMFLFRKKIAAFFRGLFARKAA